MPAGARVTRIYCGTECDRRAYRERNAHRSRPPYGLDDEWASVLLADPCAYCGAPSTTLDHIVPQASGGEDGEHNIVGACGSCNSSKQDLSLLRFLLSAVRPLSGDLVVNPTTTIRDHPLAA